MKPIKQLTSHCRLTIEDISSNDWSVYVKPFKSDYEIQMETDLEVCPSILFTYEEMENIAAFCRGFISSWQYVQQGENNDR